MSKVTISSSISVPYSFKDDSGKEVSGVTHYVMVSDGYGYPKVVKCTDPVSSTIIERDDIVYDYKNRLKTAHL